MLHAADILLYIVHTTLIIACLGGWTVPRLRQTHRWLMGAILGSWFLLGLRYGIGYCPLTDWHWQIKTKLGQGDLPNSFVKHLLDHVLPMELSTRTVDLLTLIAFYSALLATLIVWWRDRRAAKALAEAEPGLD